MRNTAHPAGVAARPLTPLGSALGGMLAAAAGTFAMDALLYTRYRLRGGADGFSRWELSLDVRTWDKAPAPAQVGRRLVEGLFVRELPERSAATVNNVTHWGYGVLNGALFGVVAGSLPATRARHGLLLGSGVWAAGYVVLPAAKLYQPIWTYDPATLAKDLSAHLVYGLTTAGVFRLVRRLRSAVAAR